MSNLISQFIPPYPSFSVSTGPHFMSAFYSCPGTRFICTIFLDFHTHALIHDARSCSLTCVQLFAIPWNYSPPGSSIQGIIQGKNIGVGCHFFLQGIFLTQGSNLHLLHLLRWQADSLPLSHLGGPRCGTYVQWNISQP